MDVTNIADVQAAADFFAEKTNGTMDILFNNAGILHMGRFEELSIAEHKTTIDVNITGIINCTHTCFSMLKQTPEAYIVNMSSGAAFYGSPEHSSYSASKFAVRSLTESLNIEFAPYDIMVTDLMPSYVQTPMIMNQTRSSVFLEKFKSRLTPEKVAQYVWKASQGRKIHWPVGILMKAYSFFALFPSVMKRLNSLDI